MSGGGGGGAAAAAEAVAAVAVRDVRGWRRVGPGWSWLRLEAAAGQPGAVRLTAAECDRAPRGSGARWLERRGPPPLPPLLVDLTCSAPTFAVGRPPPPSTRAARTLSCRPLGRGGPRRAARASTAAAASGPDGLALQWKIEQAAEVARARTASWDAHGAHEAHRLQQAHEAELRALVRRQGGGQANAGATGDEDRHNHHAHVCSGLCHSGGGDGGGATVVHEYALQFETVAAAAAFEGAARRVCEAARHRERPERPEDELEVQLRRDPAVGYGISLALAGPAKGCVVVRAVTVPGPAGQGGICSGYELLAVGGTAECSECSGSGGGEGGDDGVGGRCRPCMCTPDGTQPSRCTCPCLECGGVAVAGRGARGLRAVSTALERVEKPLAKFKLGPPFRFRFR